MSGHQYNMPPGAPVYSSQPQMVYSGAPVLYNPQYGGQQLYQGVSHPRPGPTPLFVPPRGVSIGPPMYHHPPPTQGPGGYPYPQGGVGRPQPWSPAITPPSPALVNLTTQSSAQSLPCSVQLPPRLKLLEDYCKAKQPAGVVAASESFVVAASNHGIVIEHPKSSTLQSSFSTPPPGWQGANADPFMKAASNHGIHIELPKSSRPQDPKLLPKDWFSIPGKDNTSAVNDESSGSVLVNSEAVTTRPVCASDALNQHELVLTTLMQSFMGNGDIEHIDVKSEISETNYGKSVYSGYQSNGDTDHNKDDVEIGIKEQECLKQDPAEGCELGNGDNTFSDESIDVIEDHEFLSGQVELSTHYSHDSEQELDHTSTLKGRKNEDCYDEVDGSETVHSAASVLNALEEKIHGEIVKFDKQIDMKRKQEELDDDDGLGKLTLENVKKELDNKVHGKFYLMDTGEKDKIIKNWMKNMEEASEQQDKLLTSVNEDKVSLEEVAASVVKKAIAKGVLKWVVGQNLTVETNPVIQENVVSSSESDLNEDIIGVTVSTTPDLDEVVLKSTEENNNVVFVKGAMDDRHRRISQDSDITVSNRKVESELVDTEPVPSTSERSGDDFEKFFFKCKASQHGIVIESPGKKGEVQKQMKESRDNGMENENDNARNEVPFNDNLNEIPSGLRLARKRTLSELDSGNTSREGSQSDSLDAFKMKALQRGIKIQDSKEGVLDSDAELELLNTSGRLSRRSSNSSERFSRQSSVDTARVRHASTPDPSLPILNPSSQEMKPRRKNGDLKLRPDALGFETDLLNASFASSGISEGSQIRAEAPEFVPGKGLNVRMTSYQPKEEIPQKPKIFYIPTPKEKVPNPSVSIQATPNIRHVSSETKRFRKKDSSTETSNCITREVYVNTDESHAKQSLGGRTMKPTARYVTKSVNTDVPAKRTVGINVRMKPPAKVAKETMTDALHVQDDASKADVTFLADKVKALQSELVRRTERDVVEKLTTMKSSLANNVAGISPLFTDGVESDMLKSMFHSKLAMIDEGIVECKEAAKKYMSLIQSGWVLNEIPDFQSVIPEMSQSPTKKLSSPARSLIKPGTLHASPLKSHPGAQNELPQPRAQQGSISVALVTDVSGVSSLIPSSTKTVLTLSKAKLGTSTTSAKPVLSMSSAANSEGKFPIIDLNAMKTKITNEPATQSVPSRKRSCGSLEKPRKKKDRLEIGAIQELKDPGIEEDIKMGYKFAFRIERTNKTIDVTEKVNKEMFEEEKLGTVASANDEGTDKEANDTCDVKLPHLKIQTVCGTVDDSLNVCSSDLKPSVPHNKQTVDKTQLVDTTQATDNIKSVDKANHVDDKKPVNNTLQKADMKLTDTEFEDTKAVEGLMKKEKTCAQSNGGKRDRVVGNMMDVVDDSEEEPSNNDTEEDKGIGNDDGSENCEDKLVEIGDGERYESDNQSDKANDESNRTGKDIYEFEEAEKKVDSEYERAKLFEKEIQHMAECLNIKKEDGKVVNEIGGSEKKKDKNIITEKMCLEYDKQEIDNNQASPLLEKEKAFDNIDEDEFHSYTIDSGLDTENVEMKEVAQVEHAVHDPNPIDSVTPMQAPGMLGSLDPVLYQLVFEQLLQTYPELAYSPGMLANLAMQQTGLVQMNMLGMQGGASMVPAVTMPIIGPGPGLTQGFGETAFNGAMQMPSNKPQAVAPSMSSENQLGAAMQMPSIGSQAPRTATVNHLRAAMQMPSTGSQAPMATSVNQLGAAFTCSQAPTVASVNDLGAAMQMPSTGSQAPMAASVNHLGAAMQMPFTGSQATTAASVNQLGAAMQMPSTGSQAPMAASVNQLGAGFTGSQTPKSASVNHLGAPMQMPSTGSQAPMAVSVNQLGAAFTGTQAPKSASVNQLGAAIQTPSTGPQAVVPKVPAVNQSVAVVQRSSRSSLKDFRNMLSSGKICDPSMVADKGDACTALRKPFPGTIDTNLIASKPPGFQEKTKIGQTESAVKEKTKQEMNDGLDKEKCILEYFSQPEEAPVSTQRSSTDMNPNTGLSVKINEQTKDLEKKLSYSNEIRPNSSDPSFPEPSVPKPGVAHPKPSVIVTKKDLNWPSIGSKPKPPSIPSSSENHNVAPSVSSSSLPSAASQSDFMPEFAKRHNPEITCKSVVDHFVLKPSEQVTRSLASAEKELSFVYKPPSPPPCDTSECYNVQKQVDPEAVDDAMLQNPIPDMDPVSALYEYCQAWGEKTNFEVISREGPQNKPVFTMKVTVGAETFGPCKGYNTTLAKKSVACVALNALNKKGSLEAFFKSKGGQSSGRTRRPSARETSTNQPPVAITRTRSRSLSQSDSATNYSQPSFGHNRQPSLGPFSRRQPSPGPLNRRAPSPGPVNRRAPSPSPFDRRQQYPGPLNRGAPSSGPFERRAPSPSPFSRRAPSPSPFQRCQQSPSPTFNQQPMARVSRESSSENWEDEVDNFAPTFTLHYDKKKKISSSALEKSGVKSKTADLTNPFLHPVDKSVPAPKHKGITGLCDIELPKSAKEKDEDEKKEPVEEWCEVQTKRKRHASKEPQIEVHKSSAPYVQTAAPSTTAAKTAKYSNFERLIGRMQEEYPDVERKDLIDAIQKIRKAKNSLSGLSMQTIVEMAGEYVGKKKVPGHWDNPRKPQTLVLPPRFATVASKNRKTACQEHFPVAPKSLDEPDENICVICHDGLSTEPVKELDCKHAFHTQCIAKWVEVDRTCPTCRKLALFPEEYPLLGK